MRRAITCGVIASPPPCWHFAPSNGRRIVMIEPLGTLATQPPCQETGHIAIGGGQSLFVRDWGDGAPVLLLSGWGMDGSSWEPTMAALNCHGLRAVAYDRRGHGRSTDPGRLDYDVLADDLAEILWA